jgi:AAA+ ATPase superfamily predicted ATPase
LKQIIRGKRARNTYRTFFVAMTKESHLCHVLLSGSDGYFIEKLYNDSKLKKQANSLKSTTCPRKTLSICCTTWIGNPISRIIL